MIGDIEGNGKLVFGESELHIYALHNVLDFYFYLNQGVYGRVSHDKIYKGSAALEDLIRNLDQNFSPTSSSLSVQSLSALS